MCGKFTALPDWSCVTDLAELLRRIERGDFENVEPIAVRVMDALPVILFDPVANARRVVPMRWGFPHRDNPMRPDPIHARAETIDQKPTFAPAFHDGQRGIVLVRTFNEGLELPTGKTLQHVITPHGENGLGDENAIGIAFIWRRFENLPGGFACVMATVPANALIGGIADRMPAVLSNEDWPTWLGEIPASTGDAKACLKTVEGVRWTMAPVQRARRKPTPSDPGGLF
jgi:putative SOS response-associated peptidase YedK